MDVHLKHETYLSMLGLATLSIGSYAFSRSSHRAFSRGVNWSDLALLGLATHKITRTAARDRVTAPIRAPFTKPFEELDGDANPTSAQAAKEQATDEQSTGAEADANGSASSMNAPAEPHKPKAQSESSAAALPERSTTHADPETAEHPLVRTFQHSLGELLTCPYCLAPWVALALHVGYVKKRSAARAVSSVFAVVTVSDVLNRWYGRLEKR